MTPDSLLTELDRINAVLGDPTSDNTAGKVDALRYDVLPKLLASQRHLIALAIRAYVKPSHFQSELTLMPTHHERIHTTMDSHD